MSGSFSLPIDSEPMPPVDPVWEPVILKSTSCGFGVLFDVRLLVSAMYRIMSTSKMDVVFAMFLGFKASLVFN